MGNKNKREKHAMKPETCFNISKAVSGSKSATQGLLLKLWKLHRPPPAEGLLQEAVRR